MPDSMKEKRIEFKIGCLISLILFSHHKTKFDFISSAFSAQLWLKGCPNDVTNYDLPYRTISVRI